MNVSALSFTVHGTPEPAGSKRAFVVKGRAIVTDANPKSRRWKDLVAQQAGEAMAGRPVLLGPLSLILLFFVRRPKGHYGKRGLLASAPAYPTTRPDATKLLRCAEDAMTGVVWRDDAQVVDQYVCKLYGPERVEVTVSELVVYDNGDGAHYFHTGEDAAKRLMATACPYGAPGDRLWVRETHAIVPATAYRMSHDDGEPLAHRTAGDSWAVYREGWTRCAPGRWSPSIHMPRWASRISLEVTEVRVERLHEISFDQIRAEGLGCPVHDFHSGFCCSECPDLRQAWATGWDGLNAPRGYGWDANPWVWVIRFRRVEPLGPAGEREPA